jgi:hypothetical protein
MYASRLHLPISILYLFLQLYGLCGLKLEFYATIRYQNKDDYVHLAKGAATMLQLEPRKKMIMGFVVVHVDLAHHPHLPSYSTSIQFLY